MREKHNSEVLLPDVGQEAFEACISFMYGRLDEIPQELLLPLFRVSDRFQVRALCYIGKSSQT